MPLIKSRSKKAVGENIEREESAGKPRRQSIAIALSVQRQAKKKKMARGGMVEGAEQDRNPGTPSPKPDNRRLDMEDYMADDWAGGPDPERKPDNERLPVDEYMADHFARGGMVEGMEDDGEPEFPHVPADDERPAEDEYMASHFADGGEIKPKSMAETIMSRRKHMAAGGPVSDIGDEDDGAEVPRSPYDRLNANLKENYDADDISAQPEDSNETGDDIDSDAHDMVAEIRKRIRSRR